MSNLRRRGVAALTLVLSLAIVPRLGATASAPDSHTQPLLDGCQRSQALLLGVATPEWVYVDAASVRAARLGGDRTAGRRTVEGVAKEARPAGEDLYLTHNFHDFNLLIEPDPAYAGVLSSGNLQPGEEFNVIEGEWEVSDIPMWAWPAAGDRVRAGGNWSWDCGHWGEGAADPTRISPLLPYDPVETIQDLAAPGVIRGETTELHPLFEVSTYRADAAGVLTGERRAGRVPRLDVWLNGYGDPAHSIEECALFGVNLTVAARLACSPVRDLGGHYAYTLPLGPKPSPSSRLIVNPLVIHDETDAALRSIPVSVVPDIAAGTVAVSFDLPHAPVPQRFGITVEGGWTRQPPAVLHRVTLDSIHIQRSLDGASEPNLNPVGVPGEQTPDPGDWALYAGVSGHWLRLPVYAVTDDQTITIGKTFEFWLPPGAIPTLFVSGHECDEPLMDCRREAYGATAQPLEFRELGFNDRPGRIHDEGAGVPLQPGTAAYRPEPNPDPGSGNEDLSDAVCGPDSCYQLTVTWTTG